VCTRRRPPKHGRGRCNNIEACMPSCAPVRVCQAAQSMRLCLSMDACGARPSRPMCGDSAVACLEARPGRAGGQPYASAAGAGAGGDAHGGRQQRGRGLRRVQRAPGRLGRAPRGAGGARARWAGVALVCFEAPCARLQHGQAHVGLCAESSVLRSGGHASPAERSCLHHMPHCKSALTFPMRRR